MTPVEQQLKLVKKLKQELWVCVDTGNEDSFTNSNSRINFMPTDKGRQIMEQIIKLKDDELHQHTRTD